MAKSPPKKRKDPAKPTRAKANRPDTPPTPDALADLLNPAIGKGTAGIGSGTGLTPPPETSWERRKDFSAAHTARKSTRGFGAAPQANYAASPITGLDPALEIELGLARDDDSSPSPAGGGSASIEDASRGGVSGDEDSPPAGALRVPTSPSRGR